MSRFLRPCLVALSIGSFAFTQEPTMTPTPPISRRDLLSAVLSPEASVSKVEIKEVTMGPGQKAPLHLHPCPVVGIVTRGSIAYQIEGQAVQHLKAGDAFFEPAFARVARFDNEGETTATFSAFYLQGKGEHDLIRMLEH